MTCVLTAEHPDDEKNGGRCSTFLLVSAASLIGDFQVPVIEFSLGCRAAPEHACRDTGGNRGACGVRRKAGGTIHDRSVQGHAHVPEANGLTARQASASASTVASSWIDCEEHVCFSNSPFSFD